MYQGRSYCRPNKKIFGKETISVGIVGTTKAIAICGLVGEDDEAESEANAIRSATEWNKSENLPRLPKR